MYSNSYSSYKSGRIPSSSLSGFSSSYSSGRYGGIRSSSSVPYGVTSPSYSVPLSSSTLSALALSSTTSSRFNPSTKSSAYSPASSASSSPRLSSFYNPSVSSSSSHQPTSSLTYSRSFNRGSDGYGSWSVSAVGGSGYLLVVVVVWFVSLFISYTGRIDEEPFSV